MACLKSELGTDENQLYIWKVESAICAVMTVFLSRVPIVLYDAYKHNVVVVINMGACIAYCLWMLLIYPDVMVLIKLVKLLHSSLIHSPHKSILCVSWSVLL